MASELAKVDVLSPDAVRNYSENLQLSLRYGHLNKKITAAAIEGIYRRLELKTPTIVWCDSPSPFCNLPWILAASLNHNDDPPFRSRLIDLLERNAVRKTATWSMVKTLLGSELGAQAGLGANLHEKLTEVVLKTMYSNLASAAEPVIGNHDQVKRIMQRTLFPFTERLYDQSVRLADVRFVNFKTKFSPHYYVPDRSNWLSKVLRSAGDELMFPPKFFKMCWGARELYWLATFDCFAELVDRSIFEEELLNQMADWMLVLRSGLSYAFFENVCFICCYPSAISFDDAGRWHNDSGPSLQFIDGAQLFFFHGVAVNDNVIAKKKETTLKMINLENNIEVRRIMIELYGVERYLRESRAKKVDHDQYGTLHRLEQNNDAPMVVVEVVNSTPEPDGTFKRYFLRVPPEITTAHAAVAWTFGMTAETYKPKLQT